MSNLGFDYSNTLNFINLHEISYLEKYAQMSLDCLLNKTGQGKDFLGWVDLPRNYDKNELTHIKKAADKINSDSDAFVVIGIGGSYLGARAAIEMLSHSFYNILPKNKRTTPEIYFAGNSISSTYLKELLELLEGKDVSINVVSKSGTTTEPAIAFRVFREFLEKKYGKDGASSRIYVTTDKRKGALKKLADEEGYESFIIPDDVGGRYSVLTPVGLLPIAVAGINIDEIMKGSYDASLLYKKNRMDENISMQYAVIRNILYRKGKAIEILVNYEPRLHYLSEWWKQLYGESEGKDHKGIFPASVDFTTDLHSMGQFIQDGSRNIFETVIKIEKSIEDITIYEDKTNLDGLNFLEGKTMDFINKRALQGTILAHNDGGVPNLIISIPEISAYYFGYLVYFFEMACGISGYLNGVNPFDQPGVEAYKKNMFALLGKAGYEEEKQILEKRLQK
ncbi:MAG: glucose-6-phosphate isomerase [Thermoanaerobacteraceae bacterium]|nr:glucose-6-phosphate isomerase [Thermoanaerobacteraceae bacterium]